MENPASHSSHSHSPQAQRFLWLQLFMPQAPFPATFSLLQCPHPRPSAPPSSTRSRLGPPFIPLHGTLGLSFHPFPLKFKSLVMIIDRPLPLSHLPCPHPRSTVGGLDGHPFPAPPRRSWGRGLHTVRRECQTTEPVWAERMPSIF